MRKISLLLAMFIVVLPAIANISIGMKTSERAYRYELPTEVLRHIEYGKTDTVPQYVFKEPVGSCLIVEVDTINSGTGHWIWAWMDGTKLNFRVENNPVFKTFVYGESNGIVAVKVVGPDASVITDAKVTLGGKLMKYNEESLCYETRTPRREKILRIEYGDDIKSYDIEAGKTYKYGSYRPKNGQNPFEKSYAVTDKPKYRPNDTLRWKAVVLDRRGRWQDGEMELCLEQWYSGKRKKIGTVEAEKKGVYCGAFMLTDSLELVANNNYNLVLRNDKGSVSARFGYEDYELKSLNVSVDAETEIKHGSPINLIIKATDEKGDIVTAGNAKILVNTGYVRSVYAPELFVPDVLYEENTELSPTGTTVVRIPADGFPDADMNISWRVEVNSAVYETVTKYGSTEYRRETSGIRSEVNGLAVETYDVADSVGFSVSNPLGVVFRYAIYRDNKLIETASVRQLDWRVSEPESASYTISVSHDEQKILRTVKHNANGLRLVVEQPKVLQPGAVSDIKVKVFDGKGNPVEGADITAFSVTSKFGNGFSAPQPWFYTGKDIDPFSPVYSYYRPYLVKSSGRCTPDLKELFGVDTLMYYKLLTQKSFIYSKPDSITQIAPFVIKDGVIQPVEIVYIDSKPVYIGWATNARPYSFRITEGLHTVTLRTADAQYIVRDVEIVGNCKTWLSVEARNPKVRGIVDDGRVRSSRMPAFLTPTEQAYFSRYGQMKYQVYPNIGFPYIKCGDEVVDLAVRENRYSRSGTALVPDLAGHYLETDSVGQAEGMIWKFVPDAVMKIYPQDNLIVADRTKSGKKTKHNLLNMLMPDPDDAVLTECDMVRRWKDYVDNRRYNFYFGNDRVRGSCALMLFVDSDGEMPLNIVLKSDTTVIYPGNQRSIYGLRDTVYTVMFLYRDARCSEVSVKLRQQGITCVSVTADKLSVTAESRNLEQYIRRLVERQSVNSYVGLDLTESVYSGYDMLKGEVAGVRALRKNVSAPMAYPNSALMSGSVVMEEEVAEDAVMEEGEFLAGTGVLRTDFSDAAYWRPDLVTDKNGEVHFKVRYPDDMTRWNEYFVAFKGKQRGFANTVVITRKDMAASLSVPMFAIEGDSITVVGQSVNYTADTTELFGRTFEIDGVVSSLEPEALSPSVTDFQTVSVVVDRDSVSVAYRLYGKEYSDGELRYIPVYPKGMEAVDARFDLLEAGDTVMTIIPDVDLGNVELVLQSDVLGLLMTATESIVHSNHNTNDMLASRLIALLARQQIAKYKGVEFKSGNEIKNIIRKLESNSQSCGLWSWTDKAGEPLLWVSAHVYSALLRADALGYVVKVLDDRAVVVRELVQRSLFYKHNAMVFQQLLIAEMVAQLGYSNEARALLSDIPRISLSGDGLLRYDLLAMRLGNEVSFEALDSIRHEDVLGGEYYRFEIGITPLLKILPDPEYYTLETTMYAYRLWSSAPVSSARERHLQAMTRWLLRQQRGGRWQNEYKSAEIIDMLMPQCLSDDVLWRAAKVVVRQGDRVETIDGFPYEGTFDAGKAITVEKSGSSEIYLSAAQRFWQRNVTANSGHFSVKSMWKNQNLVRGEETVLTVIVNVDKDAEYVVVSVPVPAGCSYADHQTRAAAEVHREQLRNTVNIYCERMTSGEHWFYIRLIPRFSGRYTQNPAKVEMVYFPVFNANNEEKTVEIR